MLRAMVVKIIIRVLYHCWQADEKPIQDTSSLVLFCSKIVKKNLILSLKWKKLHLHLHWRNAHCGPQNSAKSVKTQLRGQHVSQTWFTVITLMAQMICDWFLEAETVTIITFRRHSDLEWLTLNSHSIKFSREQSGCRKACDCVFTGLSQRPYPEIWEMGACDWTDENSWRGSGCADAELGSAGWQAIHPLTLTN